MEGYPNDTGDDKVADHPFAMPRVTKADQERALRHMFNQHTSPSNPPSADTFKKDVRTNKIMLKKKKNKKTPAAKFYTPPANLAPSHSDSTLYNKLDETVSITKAPTIAPGSKLRTTPSIISFK